VACRPDSDNDRGASPVLNPFGPTPLSQAVLHAVTVSNTKTTTNKQKVAGSVTGGQQVILPVSAASQAVDRLLVGEFLPTLVSAMP
jgi:hypothetical protein